MLLRNNLIYFIQGLKTENIKIGRTRQMLEERMATLQCGSPDELVFIGGILGNQTIETELHHKFSKFRLHGEWFSPSEDLLKYINANTLCAIDAIYYIDEYIFKTEMSFLDALEIGDLELLARRKQKWSGIMQKINS